MKDKAYRFSRTKYKLKELKHNRVKSVVWRLTGQQKEFIEGLGYKVVPCLYEVKTKTFRNIANIKNSKLKELHYSCKRGKQSIVMQLYKEDMRIFEEYGVKFRPIKFKIIIVS